ncbi:MAG: hypothetical protein ISS34_07760, partial [Candidatus Omnitrophica bacterium]|nr:hypothetical protein [Candidatus Omnitrophota bacterium]
MVKLEYLYYKLRRRKFFKKLISAVLSAVFCLFSLYTPDMASAKVTNASVTGAGLFNFAAAHAVTELEEIAIAKDNGRIKEAYKGTNGKLIIHIQDAHVNYEGQKNLSVILRDLIKRYGINLVLVEGGTGDLSLSLLRHFGADSTRRRVAEKYLKKGKIAGEEYLDIVADPALKFNIHGIEDKRLYKSNLEQFLTIDKFSNEAARFMASMDKALAVLKDKFYSDGLKEFEKKRSGYEKEELDLVSYCEYLKEIASSPNVASGAPRNDGEVDRLIQAQQLEGNIDFKEVNKERDRFITLISKGLPKEKVNTLLKKSIDFKSDLISPRDFYTYVKELSEETDIDIRDYPNLNVYIYYITLFENIDRDKLFYEIASLEDEVRDILPENETQERLVKLTKNLALIDSFVNLRLSPEDLKEYKSNRREYKLKAHSKFINDLAKSHNLPEAFVYYKNVIDKNIRKLERFYTIAQKRDKAFFKNALRIMKKNREKRAVLIAGGFHTENLMPMFKDEDFSYIVVSPKVVHETDLKLYRSLLKGELSPEERVVKAVLGLFRPAAIGSPYRAVSLNALVLELFDFDLTQVDGALAPRLQQLDDIILEALPDTFKEGEKVSGDLRFSLDLDAPEPKVLVTRKDGAYEGEISIMDGSWHEPTDASSVAPNMHGAPGISASGILRPGETNVGFREGMARIETRYGGRDSAHYKVARLILESINEGMVEMKAQGARLQENPVVFGAPEGHEDNAYAAIWAQGTYEGEDQDICMLRYYISPSYIDALAKLYEEASGEAAAEEIVKDVVNSVIGYHENVHTRPVWEVITPETPHVDSSGKEWYFDVEKRFLALTRGKRGDTMEEEKKRLRTWLDEGCNVNDQNYRGLRLQESRFTAPDGMTYGVDEREAVAWLFGFSNNVERGVTLGSYLFSRLCGVDGMRDEATLLREMRDFALRPRGNRYQSVGHNFFWLTGDTVEVTAEHKKFAKRVWNSDIIDRNHAWGFVNIVRQLITDGVVDKVEAGDPINVDGLRVKDPLSGEYIPVNVEIKQEHIDFARDIIDTAGADNAREFVTVINEILLQGINTVRAGSEITLPHRDYELTYRNMLRRGANLVRRLNGAGRSTRGRAAASASARRSRTAAPTPIRTSQEFVAAVRHLSQTDPSGAAPVITREAAWQSPEDFMAYGLQSVAEAAKIVIDDAGTTIGDLVVRYHSMDPGDARDELAKWIDRVLLRNYHNVGKAEEVLGLPITNLTGENVFNDFDDARTFRETDPTEYERSLTMGIECYLYRSLRVELFAGAASRLFGEGQKVMKRFAHLSHSSHDPYEAAVEQEFYGDDSRAHLDNQNAIFGVSAGSRIEIQDSMIEAERMLRRLYELRNEARTEDQIIEERKKIIWNQPRIIIINNVTGRSVIEDWARNNFYGHNPELVVFTIQRNRRCIGLGPDGTPYIATDSRLFPVGHADATKSTFREGEAFVVTREGIIQPIQEDAVDYIKQKTGDRIQLVLQGRANDPLRHGGNSDLPGVSQGEVEMDYLALAFKKMVDPGDTSRGANIVIENFGTSPDPEARIKGGYFFEDRSDSTPAPVFRFMVESAAQPESFQDLVVDDEGRAKEHYHRFYTFYKFDHYDTFVRDFAYPVYLRFAGGLFRVDTVTGDYTLSRECRAAFISHAGCFSADYKDRASMKYGVGACLRQDNNAVFVARLGELREASNPHIEIAGLKKAPGFGATDASGAAPQMSRQPSVDDEVIQETARTAGLILKSISIIGNEHPDKRDEALNVLLQYARYLLDKEPVPAGENKEAYALGVLQEGLTKIGIPDGAGILDRAIEEAGATFTPERIAALRETYEGQLRGELLVPDHNFVQKKRMDEHPPIPTRHSNDDVLKVVRAAGKKGITLTITGHMRLFDGAGSSLDLPFFQWMLTTHGGIEISDFPLTPTIASKFKAKIRIVPASRKDQIEYVAPDYRYPKDFHIKEYRGKRITEDRPYIVRRKITLDENGRVRYGQLDAAPYIFQQLDLTGGCRIIVEEIDKPALIGGMESSNVANIALTAAASILSGADLPEADIFSISVKVENDEYGGLTGGQGHAACQRGGVRANMWLSGAKSEDGDLMNPYSVFSIPLVVSAAGIKALEEHFLLVIPGKEYKNGIPQVKRTADLVNTMWTNQLENFDSEGFPLHFGKLPLAYGSMMALLKLDEAARKGDDKGIKQAIAEIKETMNDYRHRRNAIQLRWMNLMFDAHRARMAEQDGQAGWRLADGRLLAPQSGYPELPDTDNPLPFYAEDYARRVFDETHANYGDYATVRQLYDERGEEFLRTHSLYSFDESAVLADVVEESGGGYMELGAGSLGAICAATHPEGKEFLTNTLEAAGCNAISQDHMEGILEDTSGQVLEIRGYVDAEIASEPLNIEGVDQLNQIAQELGLEEVEFKLPEPGVVVTWADLAEARFDARAAKATALAAHLAAQESDASGAAPQRVSMVGAGGAKKGLIIYFMSGEEIYGPTGTEMANKLNALLEASGVKARRVDATSKMIRPWQELPMDAIEISYFNGERFVVEGTFAIHCDLDNPSRIINAALLKAVVADEPQTDKPTDASGAAPQMKVAKDDGGNVTVTFPDGERAEGGTNQALAHSLNARFKEAGIPIFAIYGEDKARSQEGLVYLYHYSHRTSAPPQTDQSTHLGYFSMQDKDNDIERVLNSAIEEAQSRERA